MSTPTPPLTLPRRYSINLMWLNEITYPENTDICRDINKLLLSLNRWTC